MSISLNGLGLNDDQVMLPCAAFLSWPSQPLNSEGEVIFVCMPRLLKLESEVRKVALCQYTGVGIRRSISCKGCKDGIC
jgi:hypothetical protein